MYRPNADYCRTVKHYDLVMKHIYRPATPDKKKKKVLLLLGHQVKNVQESTFHVVLLNVPTQTLYYPETEEKTKTDTQSGFT